ncbi:MAG TPA: sigma-54-dependent Fis family transcriptional regulator, partial [Gammaproteobacteria bacterium]|nr:sigma-54-dependent Fis family transcriptional regulator [Gammaproteobacteria bacterium]
LANHIHENSPRRNGRFIAVNCASLQESLAESLLFGHHKGAFSGADQNHQGFVESATEGTLFLDEIGELPLGVQASLLRFLESGEICPLGETTPFKANVRIIAATNRDLGEAVSHGQFRRDLFFRLNVIPLELPSLRQRKSDIPLLTKAFTRELANVHSLTAPSYTSDAIKQLSSYHWPGNLRELRNLCERLLILAPGKTITPNNLPAEIRHPESAASDFQLPPQGIHLEQLETQFIRQALEQTRGNKTRAARLLGLSRDTLLYRLKKYAIS